jgi:hypothetical protein
VTEVRCGQPIHFEDHATEQRRLDVLAQLFNLPTERVFRAAGLGAAVNIYTGGTLRMEPRTIYGGV